MAEKIPQTYANHAKVDPPFHYCLIPVLVISLLVTIWNLIRHPGLAAGWWIVVVLAAAVAVFRIRIYALRVQNRVIRLEERLRLASLVSEPLQSKIGELTKGQLIALRFASDAEIPGLLEKTLANQWTQAEIKKAIVNWRPDYLRV